MAHCININHPDYKSLVKQASKYNMGQRLLKARIAAWQSLTDNHDIFPSITEVIDMGNIEKARQHIKDENPITLESIEKGDLPILKETIARIILKDFHTDINDVYESFRKATNDSLSDYDNRIAFKSILDKITTSREKKAFVEYLKKEGDSDTDFNTFFFELFDEFQDKGRYILKDRVDNQILNVFEKVENLFIGMEENYPILRAYYHNLSREYIKKQNDDKVFRELKGRVRVVHTGMTQEEASELIDKKERELRGRLSNRAKIHYTQEKYDTKGRTSTYIYFRKPSFDDYNLRTENTRDLLRDTRRSLEIQRERFFGMSNVVSSKEILQKLVESNSNDFLSKHLLEFLPGETSIEFIDKDYLIRDGRKVSGIYYANENKIYLPRTGLTWETITHEIIHSITAHYLENNSNDQAVQDFNKLYEYARELLSDRSFYELTNKHEFMTGLFSNNNEFLNELKKLQPTSEVGEYKNLFQELWTKILEFLGIKKDNSLYQQAFSVATNVIANHRDYVLDTQEWADISNKEELLEREKEIMEADFPWINNSFAYMANEVIVVNSPFSNALKNLNSKFNPTMQKEMRETLTSLFSGIIDAHAEENHTLTRREVIDKITPAGLFHELRQEIEAYRDHFIEEGIDPSIVSNLESLIENFEDVLISAIPDINWLESLNFNPNKYNVEERGPNLANPFYTELVLDESMPIDEEAVPIDGWMVNFRHQTVRDSMTPKVKKALRNIMLTDSNGNVEYNSLGFAKKLNLEQVQYDLLEKLKHMDNAKDLETDLKALATEKPWVNSLIEYLENDEELTVQFFVVMNKAFRNYQVTRLIDNPDGSVDVKTISINETENVNLWTSSWKSNLENGMVYSPSAIYKSDLTFNMENIDNNIKFLDEFSKELSSIKRQGEEELQKFISSKIIDIKNQLNAIGIDLVTNQVKQLLDDIYAENPNRTARTVYNIENILERVKLINQWTKTQLNEGKDLSPVDILEKNRGNFRLIALQASESLEALSEPHVRENGKGYSSYTQTSYLDRLINSLTNQRNDKQRFESFLKEEYKQYDLLYDENTGIYRIPWLNDLTDARTGAAARKSMWFFEELKFGRTEYRNLSPEQYSRLLITQYFAYGDDVAAFHVPILADAPAAEFVRYKKITLNYKENIANQMLNIFRYEYDRIKLVRERNAIREEQEKNDKLRPEDRLQEIDNFDRLGHEFVMLEFLNEHIEKIDELVSKGDSASKVELMNLVKNSIIENLDAKARKSFDYLASLNMFAKTKNGKYKYLDSFGITADNIQDKMTEYFYNSYFATANIIMLTTTDLAYYKDIEDFQKRNKQIHAPGDHLYTEATYKGVKIGKEKESYIILQDIKESSDPTTIEAMEKIMNENPNLREEDKKTIRLIHEANDITDAQALRSLDSYKAIIAMHQGWNDRFENAFQNLKNNTWSLDDYNVIFNAIKPFVYTQYSQDTGVLKDPNDETKGTKKVKVATQHKNSEALLLPQMAEHYKSERLKGVIEAMKEGEIDVVMFKSAVKEGSQGVIDVSDFKTSKEISDHILSFKDNNEYFKTINYKDYRIQQPTPENLQNAWTKVGSQLRRILTMDLPQGHSFNIRGKEYTTEELLKLFDNTLIEDGLQAFFEVESIFKDKKQLQEILEKELAGNDNYAIDLINAIQLSSDGNFVLPPYDPAHSNRVQQLMHSIWKSRVSERKIKGGSVVNMSSFGISDQLKIEYHEVNGKTAIKHIEAYLPFWSNETPLNWFDYMNKETGIIEVQKLIDDKIIPEDMLEMIGYRVPTEDAYSILPIKVVGFLHRNAGEQIILPREITSRVGLDFDIDSLYLMIKEFRTRQEYNYEDAWSDFYKENKDQLQLLRDRNEYDSFIKEISGLFKDNSMEWLDIEETREDIQQYKRDVGITQKFKEKFKEWFKENKENYISKEYFETIHPDLNKDVKDMTKTERGNLFIEIAQSILSNPVTAFKQTSPGNFDGLRATSRRLNLLAQGVDYTWEQLEKMSLKELDELSGKSTLDMMDFTTQISLHRQNMTAGEIISMSAIHSVNHSLRQRTKIGISEESIVTKSGNTLKFDRFYLNGEFRQSLHDIYAADGRTLISKNNSEYTAASVDAVKDPVLSSFNLNMFTADTLLSLVGAGYSNDSVGLLMRQPIIEELTAMYFRGQEEGKNKKQVIDELELKYKEILNNIGVLDFISRYENKERSKEKLYNKTLAHNINLNAKLKNLSPQERADFNSKNKKQIQDYYLSQFRILLNFKQMLSLGDAVSSLIMATRADSSSGMAGPTNTATLDNIFKITRYRESLEKRNAILTNADIISEGVPSEDRGDTREESYRNLLRSTKLGFIQSFATLGLAMNAETMKEHFPHFGKAMRQRIQYFESKYSPTEHVPVAIQERIVNEYITYFMSQFEEFSSDKSKYYLSEFPNKFIKWKNDNPELMDNHFIRNLSLNKATKDVPVSHIKLRTAGSLSPSMRDSIMRDWESLLYNEKYNKMATELLIYTFHRNGLNFGGDTFAHLAPVSVRLSVGDYRSNIMKLMDISDKVIQENDYIYEDIFFEQLIRNFSKDSRMVLTLEKNTFFIDDSGNALEEITLDEDYVPMELSKEDSILPFFNIKVGNDLLLYKTIEQEDGRFLFKRIDPLNIHRATSNYSYDNSGLESHETLIKEAVQENLEREREAREAYFNDPSNYVDVTETAGSFGNFVDNSLLNDTQSEKRETPQEDIPAHTLEDFYDQIDYDREYWREEQVNQQEQQVSELGQESDLPTSDEIINIYAGTNENSDLSNFAIRPFTTNVETPSGEKQYTFQSVEQGFHFYKALVANNPQVAKQILATTNGGQLKRLTNRSNLKMTPEQVKEWDDTSKSIMLNLMYDSYAQNPKAAEKLLATGNAKITHTQDNTRWKTDFPDVVMTVRDMLKEEGFGQESTSIQDYSYDVLGNKTQSNFSGVEGAGVKIVSNPNSHLAEQQRGEAVVAYRNSRNPIESFGNPFTDTVNRSTKENVDDFVNWILSENTNLNPEQHSWIREQLQSGRFKGKPIYYGNTKAAKENVPSHATALDYLINAYNWNTQITQQQKQPLTKEQEDALYWEQEEEFLKWLESQNPNEIQDIIDNC